MSHRILTVENDRDTLLSYWRGEQKLPRWYRKWCSTGTELPNWYRRWSGVSAADEFLEFCSKHTVYEVNGSALLYVRKIGNCAHIHFTVKRGSKEFSDLWAIREHLFASGIDIIYGYILKQNFPLKRVCRMMGMQWNGLTTTDAQGLEGQCYSIHRYSVYPPTWWQKFCLSLRLKVLRLSRA